ncbi:hypothetical protein APTSU1_001809200 [Apodemus speciosus]|uniref:Uncharacterized protein n=1 Tax=Apodemus speciosus TaxID=105296 RepID=A0ABQ0FUB9_APOSI
MWQLTATLLDIFILQNLKLFISSPSSSTTDNYYQKPSTLSF